MLHAEYLREVDHLLEFLRRGGEMLDRQEEMEIYMLWKPAFMSGENKTWYDDYYHPLAYEIWSNASAKLSQPAS